ncbi:MAG: hypothetical protein AAFY74_20675, partial [Pseudomonadota bacterium]
MDIDESTEAPIVGREKPPPIDTSILTRAKIPSTTTQSAQLEGLQQQLQALREAVDKVQSTLDDLKREHVDADQKYAEARSLHEASERRSQQTERDLMETLRRSSTPQMPMAYPQFMPMMAPYGGQLQQAPPQLSEPQPRSTVRELPDRRDTNMLRRQSPRLGSRFDEESSTWNLAMIDSGAVQSVTFIESGYVD